MAIIALIRGCQSIFLSDALKVNKEISKLDSTSSSKYVPKEYLALFLNKGHVIADSSLISRHKNPVAELNNALYYIQVYKLDSSKNVTINDISYKAIASPEMSLNTYYVDASINRPYLDKYKLGPSERISSVYFNLYGDSTRIIQRNDSVLYCRSNFENFSIRYQKDGKIGIYGKVNDSFQKVKVPLEVMFLKKNDGLYFILLTNKNRSSTLDSNSLYDLIIKS
ncbi:MAG TPA: hypothetical protein VHS53_11340 [Mucilaginibacter sp.]|nr:hypothetical protein [Mucilaginibacter sp.]